MKTYEYRGRLCKFPDDKVPEGAILHAKVKPVKVVEKTAAAKPKAKKAPANKARKAGSNK